VTSCRRPRLPRTAVKALHRRSFFYLDRTEPAYPIGGSGLSRPDLDRVDWKAELTDAANEALAFSGLDASVKWLEYSRGRAAASEGSQRVHGRSALDAHRTMRNNRGECALKGCGAPLPTAPVLSGRFRYCSETHAERDAEVAP